MDKKVHIHKGRGLFNYREWYCYFDGCRISAWYLPDLYNELNRRMKQYARSH